MSDVQPTCRHEPPPHPGTKLPHDPPLTCSPSHDPATGRLLFRSRPSLDASSAVCRPHVHGLPPPRDMSRCLRRRGRIPHAWASRAPIMPMLGSSDEADGDDQRPVSRQWRPGTLPDSSHRIETVVLEGGRAGGQTERRDGGVTDRTGWTARSVRDVRAYWTFHGRRGPPPHGRRDGGQNHLSTSTLMLPSSLSSTYLDRTRRSFKSTRMPSRKP